MIPRILKAQKKYFLNEEMKYEWPLGAWILKSETLVQIFVLPFVTVGVWSSDLISLSLCLSICKMGVKGVMKR